MSFILVNKETNVMHAKLSFKTKALAEEHLEDHGWRRDGEVWIGPSTGSRVIIVSKKNYKGAQS